MSVLLKQKTYAVFEGTSFNTLSQYCSGLLSEQREEWPDLRKGCELLGDIKERKIRCQGFSVRLQNNSGRIKSSLAGADGTDTKDRRCFLCLDHLPEGQKGVRYRKDFLILCNPMPILSFHFTISRLDHRPQDITEHIDSFLHLMADYGPGWVVLYNGPRCGASAPEHLHFQAATSKQMPIETEVLDKKRLILTAQLDGVLLYRVGTLGREVVILEGDDPLAVGHVFKGFLRALKKVLLTGEEPMINVVGFHENGAWRLVIFPRRKHRPDSFFRKGDARVVVSPGVIDMGGVLVTPVGKDFEGLDAASVEAIYREVSLEGTSVERAIRETVRGKW